MTMPRRHVTEFLVAAVVLIAGCATPARVDQMTATPPSAASQAPAALRQAIVIKDVTGGQETNPLWISQVSSAEFERALEASLRAAGLLDLNRQAGRYTLTAQLGKLEQPLAGISMTVTASVQYVLVERVTQKTVWENTIVTPYTASFGEALIGAERLKIANEGAVRTNISELISQLSRLMR